MQKDCVYESFCVSSLFEIVIENGRLFAQKRGEEEGTLWKGGNHKKGLTNTFLNPEFVERQCIVSLNELNVYTLKTCFQIMQFSKFSALDDKN